MSNPKNAAWYGGGLDAIMVPGANLTDNGIFYVDGVNGADTNTGLEPNEAFLTISNAIGECNDDENNYIIVLDWPADGSPPAGEDYPIALTIDRLHLIGAAYPYLEADKYAFLGADDDNEIFSIQSNWTEIAYFKLSGGTNHAAIEYGATPVICKSSSIHHCQFSEKTGTIGNAAYGIWMEAPNTLGGNWCHIAYNKFYPQLTTHGILMGSNPAYAVVDNNLFIKPGGIAINVTNQPAYMEITNNRFSLAADTTGFAITFQAAAVGYPAWIDGNHAHYGSTAMGQNPYRDIGVIPGPLENNWGLNYVGISPTFPVTV